MDRIFLASALSWVLFALYFGWGLYLLHLRYRRHVQLNPLLEIATLGALILFYTFEFALLRNVLKDDIAMIVLSSIGLVVSGLALYGPLMMSLTSHALVGMLMPAAQPMEGTPHFGPAEQYEEIDDFEAALREYQALAVSFPDDPTVVMRLADSLSNLERHDEAVPWFEKALANETEPEAAMLIVSRLVEMYTRRLEEPQEAMDLLEEFIERFPEDDCTDIARRRLKRLQDVG
jgi:tetratricopeptide (TPR) repeat protein